MVLRLPGTKLTVLRFNGDGGVGAGTPHRGGTHEGKRTNVVRVLPKFPQGDVETRKVTQNLGNFPSLDVTLGNFSGRLVGHPPLSLSLGLGLRGGSPTRTTVWGSYLSLGLSLRGGTTPTLSTGCGRRSRPHQVQA